MVVSFVPQWSFSMVYSFFFFAKINDVFCSGSREIILFSFDTSRTVMHNYTFHAEANERLYSILLSKFKVVTCPLQLFTGSFVWQSFLSLFCTLLNIGFCLSELPFLIYSAHGIESWWLLVEKARIEYPWKVDN